VSAAPPQTAAPAAPDATAREGAAGAPLLMQPPAGAGGKEAGWPRPTAPVLVAGGLVALAFVSLFHRWLYVQHFQCVHAPADWGHAYFVPLISAYIAWQHRDALLRARPMVFWPGLAPLVLGITAYAFFAVGFTNHMAQGWSMILALYGVLLLLLGPAVMRYLTLPVAYLVFGVTISERIMQDVTSHLQLIASHGSYVLLSLMGITTDISGVTLTVFDSKGTPLPLNVAEACSGMRQLIAFMALGAAVALVACPYWWQRVSLIMLAPPVAILINIVRVAALGVLSLLDPNWASGEAHTFVGTLLLVPAFLVYMGLVWALKRIVREPAPAAAPAGAGA
jgi:exosortase